MKYEKGIAKMSKDKKVAVAAEKYFANRGRISPEEIANELGIQASAVRIRIAQLRLWRSLHN